MKLREFYTIILILLSCIYFSNLVRLRNIVKLDNIHVCPNNEALKDPLRNLKFTKINITHSALSVDYGYARDLDDKTGFSVQMERWSDGGWVEWPFLSKQKNMCTTMMKLFPDLWVDMNKDTNITRPDKCPVPAGHYHLENHIFDFSNIHAPVRLGKFRITVSITDDTFKEMYYCLAVEVSVIQEPK